MYINFILTVQKLTQSQPPINLGSHARLVDGPIVLVVVVVEVALAVVEVVVGVVRPTVQLLCRARGQV
jgi:hypothetical protein